MNNGEFMIILYLALIVVIIGVIFVITSVEVVRPGRKSSVKERMTGLTADKDIYRTPDHIVNDIVPEEYNLPEVDLSDDHDVADVKAGKDLLSDTSFEVILYTDEHGVSMDSGVQFNSDFASLKNIVRVGRGIAEISPDGITIRIEKTLYRFDFYRLEKIISRDNHAILSIAGASGSHIIVSENGDFPEKLQKSYTIFQGKKQ